MIGKATSAAKGLRGTQAACLWALSLLGLATAEDQVTWLDAQDQQRTRSGEILVYDRDELRLQLPQGTTRRIAADRVLEVVADLGEPHRAADAHYERGEYDHALRKYRTAYRQESRDWVKQQMIARSVHCLANLGRIESAATTFLAMLNQRPLTPQLGAIPLLWRSKQPDRAWETTASEWLNDSQRPVARLIAASWLL